MDGERKMKSRWMDGWGKEDEKQMDGWMDEWIDGRRRSIK
jgi:hypothetical protein